MVCGRELGCGCWLWVLVLWGCRVIVFVVGVWLLRMILISIDHVGCRVIFEYRGFEGGWGVVCRVGRVGGFEGVVGGCRGVGGCVGVGFCVGFGGLKNKFDNVDFV